MAERLWTIGHSTHSIDRFLQMLEAHGVECLADVRRYPGSRAHPHFNPEPLARSLGERGIAYLPLQELGGRRNSRGPSTNTVWRNAAFRAYADYMASPEFAAGLERLTATARQRPTAVMCSEAVWWRCHRSLIADALKASGWQVLHIMGSAPASEHPYTSAARIVDGVLTYTPPDSEPSDE